MYLIIDKKTRAILHMSNSNPGLQPKVEDLLPGFDAKTMDFGRAAEQYIPARFEIVDGVVKNLDPLPPDATPAAAETLAQARARRRADITAQALAMRGALVPDYQLLNAGLGIYDDVRKQTLQATVNAFRDAVRSVEAGIDKAKTIKDIDALVPVFPTALVVALKTPAPPKAAATKVK